MQKRAMDSLEHGGPVFCKRCTVTLEVDDTAAAVGRTPVLVA